MEAKSAMQFQSSSEAAQCSNLMPGTSEIYIELINKYIMGVLRE
jgi:hypothetical protein